MDDSITPKVIAELRKKNEGLLNTIHQMGGDLDPLAYVQIQMQAMVDLFGQEGERLEQLELLYQGKLCEVLTMATKQAREAGLMIEQAQKKLVKPAKPRIIKPGEN